MVLETYAGRWITVHGAAPEGVHAGLGVQVLDDKPDPGDFVSVDLWAGARADRDL